MKILKSIGRTGLIVGVLVLSLSIGVYAEDVNFVENSESQIVEENIEAVVRDIKDFKDITESHRAYNAFKYLIEKEVVFGVGIDTLAPESTLSRAQFITMLCRDMTGYKTFEVGESPYFEDVHPLAWYAGAVEWGRNHNVTNGISETLFGSDTLVTKEQMVQMVYNYVQNNDVEVKIVESKDSPIKDSQDISDWAYDGVTWANLLNILDKDSNGNFNPKAPATRSDMAILLYNFDMVLEK